VAGAVRARGTNDSTLEPRVPTRRCRPDSGKGAGSVLDGRFAELSPGTVSWQVLLCSLQSPGPLGLPSPYEHEFAVVPTENRAADDWTSVTLSVSLNAWHYYRPVASSSLSDLQLRRKHGARAERDGVFATSNHGLFRSGETMVFPPLFSGNLLCTFKKLAP
jgi:hypothetical protein